MLQMRKFESLDLTYLLRQTVEWNKISRLGKFDFSEEAKQLQAKCLQEEVNELRQAVKDQDGVEMLDALCDILFVSAYAAFLKEGGSLNYESLIFTYDDVVYEELKTFNWEDMLNQMDSAVEQELFYEICMVTLGMGLVFDVDFKAAYENVVESNFTKFPLTDDVMVGAELEWFNAESKYDDVCVEEFEGHFIFRCDGGDGKIVKPRLFVEPELEQFING